jgi:hypothetical protein
MNFSHRAFASHHLTRDSKCVRKAAGREPSDTPRGHRHFEDGLAGSLVLGGNQAAPLGVISGLQAFAISRAMLLGIQRPVRTPGKAKLVLHLRVSSCGATLANPGRLMVTRSRQ